MQSPTTPSHDPVSSSLDPQRRFLRRVMIAVGVVALAVILAVTFGFAWDAMLTIFGGALMGVLLDGVACRIAKWTRMPRWLALVLVCLLAVGALVGMGFWLGPAMSEHVVGLREQVTIAWQDFMEWVNGKPWGPELLRTITPAALGDLDGAPLGFTDASPLPDGSLIYVAAAEASRDTYHDGLVTGAVIGRLGPGRAPLWQTRVPGRRKLEGVHAELHGDDLQVWLVDDPDHRQTPAALLHARLDPRTGAWR